MKVCLPQLVRTGGRCKSSAGLIRMKTTIASSDVKFKINFPRQIFLHYKHSDERWKCRLLARVFRSNRSSASVDEKH